ncbi:hypothetical protein [Mycolicibacterium baixiangningiae]|uniref:hypothetical protein n=1 Tax=Mycolicibacterium baixiangningiae TaxID=2761578 RepID=UPI0018695D39|nr:hypothetical protein [Mycolicibacterium baixiangningiae]
MQTNPKMNDVAHNVDAMVNAIAELAAADVQLAVFPEWPLCSATSHSNGVPIVAADRCGTEPGAGI